MKNAKYIVLVLIVLLTAGTANAQSYYHRENGIYLELFGTGGEASINYEKIINNMVSVRVGVGGTGAIFEEGLAVPFSASYLLGSNQNYLELGIGGAYYSLSDDITDDTFLDITESQVVGNGIIGYRYLGDYGYTFRLAFTPAITKDGFQAMGGAMIGLTF